MLGILLHIQKLQDFTEGKCTIYCDNKGALNNISKAYLDDGIYPLLEANYDPLNLACLFLTRIHFTVQHEWVEGHYIENAQMLKHDQNGIANTMATGFQSGYNPLYKPSEFPLFHPFHIATVSINNSSITTKTSKLGHTIYSVVHVPTLQETICKNLNWDAMTCDCINWDAHEATFMSHTRYQIIAVSKLVHNLWNSCYQCKQHLSTADISLPPVTLI